MQTRHQQIQILQHHVLGLVSIIGLLFISFPFAYWRVSRSEKFAGMPMKSLQLEESQKPKIAEEKTPEVTTKEEPAVSIQPVTQPQLLSPEKQEALKAIVYEKIDQHWQSYPNFAQSLLYHIDVNKQGEITAFKPLTQAAKTDLNEIPLSQLIQPDLQPQTATLYKQFTVIFHTDGVLEVHH